MSTRPIATKTPMTDNGPWPVPDGLPRGRFIVPDPQYTLGTPGTEPVLWITEEPMAGAGPVWARLLGRHADTGWWPLLLTALQVPDVVGAPAAIRDVMRRSNPPGRPWLTGELAPVRADDVDAAAVLAAGWARTTGTGVGGFDFGDDALPAVPFRTWPGLADPGAPGVDPTERAADLARTPAGVRELTGRADPPHLGLVPAADGAAAITGCGWRSQAGDAAEIAAVVRSWQARFGARLGSLGMDTLGVAIAWPPATEDHARRVAAEHFAFCADLADMVTFDDYARDLIGAPVWSFWWD
jgi:hypothetical protein